MKFKPYLAIDTETTSLDPKTGKILQLAAVYDDGINPIEHLRSFNWFIDLGGESIIVDSVALAMNAWIFKEITSGPPNKVGRITVVDSEFYMFVDRLFKGNNKITVAGKNLAGFDIPFLNSNGFHSTTNLFSHKVIDVGSLYLPDFGYVPSLDEVNKLIGRQKVSHNALDDCYDVVYAIRHKLQIGV